MLSPKCNKSQMTSPKGNRLRKQDGDRGLPVCEFCFQSQNDDEMSCGEMLCKRGKTVHYFCLLLASGLCQNARPSDKKSILGFLVPDIDKELWRGKRLRCYYCRELGATIGCCFKNCKKAFHLPCGQQNGCISQFFDQFRSFCEEHAPSQSYRKRQGSSSCSICFENLARAPLKDVAYCICCAKSWLHRTCVQQYALSAGLHHFKCPHCNATDKFIEEMMKIGIYVPDRDASWELGSDAYADLIQRHSQCDAETCVCPKGRSHDAEKGQFELLLCNFCGAFGSHSRCRGLRLECRKLACPPCAEISQQAEKKRKEMKRKEKRATPPEAPVAKVRKLSGTPLSTGRGRHCKTPADPPPEIPQVRELCLEDPKLLFTSCRVCLERVDVQSACSTEIFWTRQTEQFTEMLNNYRRMRRLSKEYHIMRLRGAANARRKSVAIKSDFSPVEIRRSIHSNLSLLGIR